MLSTTARQRSRPQSCTQSGVRIRNAILTLCHSLPLRWFVNLISLRDHLSYVDVYTIGKKPKCVINNENIIIISLDASSPVIGERESEPNMQMFDSHEDECPWYYFDSSYKTLLGVCLFLFGTFGVLLNGWLFATFIHSHLLIFKSHILVLNLCIGSLGRNLFGFPFAGSSAVAKRWLFGPACCQFFGFFHQFFGVFQMTAIFVIVLERYLIARFYRREKSPCVQLHWIFVGVSWLNSAIFAIPPLFGYGIYSCDTTGTSCTFLWPSVASGARHIGYSVPYVLVCGIIPIVGMFFYMGKAIRLEKIFYKGEQQREQHRLTQSIHAVCVSSLTLWVPAGALVGWQWLPLLVYGYRPHVPPALAMIASIASEAATSVPVLCYLAGDERLRAALLGRMRKHYALLRPDLAKRYNRV